MLSIIIVLGSFYLLIFYSEKFSTWIWRLQFAVNVNLNLTIVIYRYCDLILEVQVNVSQNSVLIAPFKLSLPCREGLGTEWVTPPINQMWPAANILLLRESSKGGGGLGEGVMFSFHVQILINFRYDFGYKPIFTSYESHLFIKGAKNRKTVILDPNSHYIWRLQFSPLLLLMSVGRSKRALTSSHGCGKFVSPGVLRSNWKQINAPDATSFYPPATTACVVFWLVLLFCSPRARACVLEISPFALTKPVPSVQATATRPFVRAILSILTRKRSNTRIKNVKTDIELGIKNADLKWNNSQT